MIHIQTVISFSVQLKNTKKKFDGSNRVLYFYDTKLKTSFQSFNLIGIWKDFYVLIVLIVFLIVFPSFFFSVDYIGLGCCALAFLLYFNTLEADFVYDDR